MPDWPRRKQCPPGPFHPWTVWIFMHQPVAALTVYKLPFSSQDLLLVADIFVSVSLSLKILQRMTDNQITGHE